MTHSVLSDEQLARLTGMRLLHGEKWVKRLMHSDDPRDKEIIRAMGDNIVFPGRDFSSKELDTLLREEIRIAVSEEHREWQKNQGIRVKNPALIIMQKTP